MLNLYPADKARPIVVMPNDSITGPRIGGKAPEGVNPAKISALTQYFATLQLDDSANQEVSLFVDLDAEESSANSIYRNVSRLYHTEEFVQIVVHAKCGRSNSSLLVSSLSGHALQIGAERPDTIVQPGGELQLPSKMGGRPYFFYNAPDYIKAMDHLFSHGFVLFLQMTWAGFRASPSGPWPFDEYTFHLLAKRTPDGIIWRYGWG